MDNLGKRSRKYWKIYEIWKLRDGSGRNIICAEEWVSLLKEAKVLRAS
jgi:hypothetical protein